MHTRKTPHEYEYGCLQVKERSFKWSFPHSHQKKPTLTTPWSWPFSFCYWNKINFGWNYFNSRIHIHPRALEIFSRMDHMLSCTISLSKFKKTESIQNIFSDNNEMKLEINNKKKIRKFKKMWKLNNTLEQPMSQRRNHKRN